GSSSARIPAAASSGSVSSKMRPFESASVITGKRAGGNRAFYRKGRGKPCISTTLAGTSGYAFDARSELSELLLDAFIAAVEMVDAVDAGLAVGDQTGDHQARGGTQVRRHDIRALKPRHAVDDRSVAGDLDIGAQTLHFERVHEAVLENG